MSWQGGRSRILPPPLRQMARAPHLISNQQQINKQQQKHQANNEKINKHQTKKHISLNPATSTLLIACKQRNFHSVWNIREHDRLCWFHFERIPMDTGGGGRRLAGGTLQRCPLILHSGHSPLPLCVPSHNYLAPACQPAYQRNTLFASQEINRIFWFYGTNCVENGSWTIG